MMGRIKWLNQHPEAIMLMVQQRMFIPFTIMKTHYRSNIAPTKDSLLYGQYFCKQIVDFKVSIIESNFPYNNNPRSW